MRDCLALNSVTNFSLKSIEIINNTINIRWKGHSGNSDKLKSDTK